MKHGRNNNLVKIVKRNEKVCVVKSFGDSAFELDKFTRELSFYKSCNGAQCRYVPKLYDYSRTTRKIYIEKIEEIKPIAFTIEFYNAALEFIGEINRSKLHFNSDVYAQENLIDRSSLHKYLVQRYSKIDLPNKYVPLGFDAKFKKTIQELESVSIDFGPLLVNPSDIGLHNALHSDDQYYFIDFEYAGFDTFAKLAYDFYLHPANYQNLVDPKTFFSDLSCALGIPNQKYDLRIGELFCMWWVIRLINQLQPSLIKHKMAMKIINHNELPLYVEQRVKLINKYWDMCNA